MEIRLMRQEDETKVYALISNALDEYFRPEVVSFFRMQWPAGQIVACDFAGNVIGYLAGAKLPNGHASIHLFAVSEGFREQGVGTMILNRFRQSAVMEGFPVIQLEVKEGNTPVIEFYRRRGFKATQFLEGFYNDGSNGIRMECESSPGSPIT